MAGNSGGWVVRNGSEIGGNGPKPVGHVAEKRHGVQYGLRASIKKGLNKRCHLSQLLKLELAKKSDDRIENLNWT